MNELRSDATECEVRCYAGTNFNALLRSASTWQLSTTSLTGANSYKYSAFFDSHQVTFREGIERLSLVRVTPDAAVETLSSETNPRALKSGSCIPTVDHVHVLERKCSMSKSATSSQP